MEAQIIVDLCWRAAIFRLVYFVAFARMIYAVWIFVAHRCESISFATAAGAAVVAAKNIGRQISQRSFK